MLIDRLGGGVLRGRMMHPAPLTVKKRILDYQLAEEQELSQWND